MWVAFAKDNECPGPSCSKLTTSLVNDSLKIYIEWYANMLKFFAEKKVSSFCSAKAFAVQKLLTFLSAKNIRILYIESAKTVNEMILNELTTLWTTGPRSDLHGHTLIWTFALRIWYEGSFPTLQILWFCNWCNKCFCAVLIFGVYKLRHKIALKQKLKVFLAVDYNDGVDLICTAS